MTVPCTVLHPIGSIPLIPVIHAQNPIITAGNRVKDQDLTKTPQIVVRDRSKHTKEQNFSVLNHHIWSVSDIHCKYMMIREGIGWGTLPQKMVQKDIEDGILCVVEPQSWKDLSLNIPMVALYHKGSILSHYAQDFITECMNVLAPT